MRKLTYTLILSWCLFLVAAAASAQSRIPSEVNNFLQVTGQSGLGGLDIVNVIFFEIPDSETSTLYFAIRSPDNDNANFPEADDGNPGDTTHYLIGGSGALSDGRSRQLMYDAGELAANDHLTGTNLQDQTFGAFAGEWFYFNGVSPSQGEHIANKYYFKIVTVAEAGTSGKNGYQLEISTTNSGAPTGLAGVRAFAYSWLVGFHWSNRDWSLYPLVPENNTGFVVFSNFDFDADQSPDPTGAAYDKSNAVSEAVSLGAITSSLNGVPYNTSHAIGASEDNGTWKAKYNEGTVGVGYYNTSEIWHWNSGVAVNDAVRRDTVQPYRTYSAYFAPSPADHVVLTTEDGMADADGVDAERVLIQIVDSMGSPQHYIRDVYMRVSGSAEISTASDTSDSLPAASALVSTDSDGLAWITVINNSSEVATVTAVTDGSNGSDTLPGTNQAVNITFGSGSAGPQFLLRNNIINPRQGDVVSVAVGLSASQRIRAIVFDLAGNPVKTLADSTFAAGTHTITWDGKSKRGRAVTQDVYFIVVTGDGTRKIFKVLVTK
jgi:hypothetical protein